MDYGRALRIVRTARGLSKSDLAKRLRIGASHLSLIEAGKRNPSIDVLEELSTALRVPPHLFTILASDPEDLERPGNAEHVSTLAHSLVRLLVAADDQPELPMEKPVRRKRSA